MSAEAKLKELGLQLAAAWEAAGQLCAITASAAGCCSCPAWVRAGLTGAFITGQVGGAVDIDTAYQGGATVRAEPADQHA